VNQTLNLSFTENWFLDQRLTLGGQLGFTHAVNSKIDQDVLGPTYSDSEIPDPYRDNEYVFTKSTSYGGATYEAGQLFPGIPTSSDISTYSLITRYQYDTNNGTVKSNSQMKYDSWQFTLGVNTGYSWYTALGRFGLGTGEKTTLQYVTYDSSVYRPANQSLRENLNQWRLSDQWWTKVTFDTRDIIYNPSNGFLAQQTVTFAGGFLSGQTHFTRLDTRLENFWKPVSVPLADKYSFELVLRVRTAFSFLLPPLGGSWVMTVQPSDELYIDGMTSGRGWGYQTGGKSSWISGAEIRTPVPFAGDILWFDTFLDHSILVDTAATYATPFEVPVTSQKFAWGSGLRIVSPQFPLALYLAKPFRLEQNGTIVWTKGDGIFGDTADMKLVVAFGMEY